jgi:hypothetical protein
LYLACVLTANTKSVMLELTLGQFHKPS